MIRKTLICIVGVLAGASTGAYVDGFFEQDNVVTRAFDDIAAKFSPQDSNAPAINSAEIENSLQSNALKTSDLVDTSTVDVNEDQENGSVRTTSAGTPSELEMNSDFASAAGSTTVNGDRQQNNSLLNDAKSSAAAMEKGSASKRQIEEGSHRKTMAVDLRENADGLEQRFDGSDSSALPKRDSESFLDEAKSIPSSPSMASSESDNSFKADSDDSRIEDFSSDRTSDAPFGGPETAASDPVNSMADKKLARDAASIAKAKSQALLDVRFTREIFRSPSGGVLKYRKLSPRVSDDRPLPLIIFLHGIGERGDDNVAQLKNGLQFLASREGMQEFPATVIAPQCPPGDRWSLMLAETETDETTTDPLSAKLKSAPSKTMRLTQELIASAIESPNVDRDRVYVTGLSMGGFGTFELIARMPSVFAAAVPLCGGGDTRPVIINRIKDVPMWIIHGDQDSVVNVEYSRELVAALRDAGSSPRYSELTGFGHNIWDATYADRALYEWIFNKRNSGNPNSNSNVSQTQIRDRSKRMDPSNRSAKTADATARKPAAKRSPGAIGNRNSPRTASFNGAINGNWKVLAATQQGRRADGATLTKMKVAIKGDQLLIEMGSKTERAKLDFPEENEATYPLVDIISLRKGVKNSKGIFAKQGDKLVICWGMPGNDRPETFDSKAGVKTLVLEKQ